MLLYAVCAICLACLLVAKGSAGFLRSRCTPAIDRRVQADLIWNEKLQSLRCGPLTAFVNASANLVSVPFYIATLPIITWLGGEAITRHLLLYMAILNYFGLFGKDLFCAPRPLGCSAPASILQPLLHHIPERERVHNNEYGLPSTHTSQSLGYFVYLALLSSDALHLSRAQTLALAALAVLLGAWVAAGRMYSLMHSLTDVLAGTALTVLTLSTYTALSPTIEAWLMSDAPVGAQTLAACVIAMYCYPRPLKPTPSFEDAVAFLGAAAGFLAGAHSTRGLPPQPALDLAAPAHLRAQALQLLVGAALAYAAKEGSSVTVRPVIVATMARVPLRVRAWWQLPALSAVAGAAPQRGLVRMADSAASLQQLAADQGPWSSPETVCPSSCVSMSMCWL